MRHARDIEREVFASRITTRSFSVEGGEEGGGGVPYQVLYSCSFVDCLAVDVRRLLPWCMGVKCHYFVDDFGRVSV